MRTPSRCAHAWLQCGCHIEAYPGFVRHVGQVAHSLCTCGSCLSSWHAAKQCAAAPGGRHVPPEAECSPHLPCDYPIDCHSTSVAPQKLEGDIARLEAEAPRDASSLASLNAELAKAEAALETLNDGIKGEVERLHQQMAKVGKTSACQSNVSCWLRCTILIELQRRPSTPTLSWNCRRCAVQLVRPSC